MRKKYAEMEMGLLGWGCFKFARLKVDSERVNSFCFHQLLVQWQKRKLDIRGTSLLLGTDRSLCLLRAICKDNTFFPDCNAQELEA